MTIHSEHPFQQPEGDRDPVRRLRGRLGPTVSLWTTGQGSGRAGLTVSSYVVVNGDPAHLLALVDPDSDFYPALLERRTAVMQLLEWEHRGLADAFAGQAPAPGGVFRMGEWSDTGWGPLLSDVGAWAGVRLDDQPRAVGWSMLVDTVVEHIEIAAERAPLVHRLGRYLRPS